MKKPKTNVLTEVELELMNLLWPLGEGTVNDVLAHMPKGRKLAYTSVSTVLRILEQKGVLKSRKEGRGHVYTPILRKGEYEAASVTHLVNKVFGGAPLAAVRQLLDTSQMSDEDLRELRDLLNKKEGPGAT